ncbi:MAG: DUF2723 domain-containing protein, partial [Chloroflexi bacterium]|nr:DUF2723 domain-containing protein [Chloroflexota bacterium]
MLKTSRDMIRIQAPVARSKQWLESIPGLFLAGLSFALYVRTLAPGVWGFDSAELATGVHTLGIVHPPGYPLYLLVGKLFSLLPMGSLAYRLNLMSAFFGALAVWLVYRLIVRLTDRKTAAWTGAGLFAISNYFWQMAIVAEVYTLHVFFLALDLGLLLDWVHSRRTRSLVMFAFFYGLSLANHTSGILFAPGYLWLVFATGKFPWKAWREWLPVFPAFLLGLAPYLYLPIRTLADPSLNYIQTYYNIDLTTGQGLWWMVSGKAYRFFAFGYPLHQVPAEAIRFLGFLWRNTLGLGALLGLAGLATNLRQQWKIRIAFLLIFLGNAVFFINYRVMDKDTMFLPAYLVWSVWAGEGIAWLENALVRLSGRVQAPLPVKQGMAVIMTLVLILGAGLNFQWVDMSTASGSEAFTLDILATVPQGATVIAQWSPAVMLEYHQVVNGERPDIRIINRSRMNVAEYYRYWTEGWDSEQILERIAAHDLQVVRREIEQRPVYIVEYDPLFANDFEYLPA